MIRHLLILSLLLVLPACQKITPPSIIAFTGKTMGTLYRIKLVTPELKQDEISAITTAVQTELESLNQEVNHYDATSQISEFNALGANEFMKLAPNFHYILRLASTIHKQTEGALDVTVSPWVNLWGFGPNTERRAQPPSQEEIDALETLIGQDKVIHNRQGEWAKTNAGIQLNLSAIAKGYAVDAIVAKLKAMKFKNFLVEIGGEVFASGHNATGELWNIGINEPSIEAAAQGKLYKQIALKNQAMATSGNYQNFFDHEGKRYSHILDPRTGHPVQNNIVSVTVIAQTCVLADAAATTITVLGPEAGITWAKKEFPSIDVLILTRNGSSIEEYRT